MTQWHPIFAQLLRPVVEAYYEFQTTVPVGDAPREADFVLLRRMSQATPPFRGLWRHLTPWSILEYKGPTVSPRRGDIELSIELGLGIDRRLRAEHGRLLPPEAVSFWYLANHLGRRFLNEVMRKLGPPEALDTGLWRSRVLGRAVFWVSSIEVPVEEDSLPLHIVGHEPSATERRVAQLVVDDPILQQRYGGWLASLHPTTWTEIEAMARASGKQLPFDIRPAVESLGLDRVIEQVGLDRVIEQVGLDRVIEQVGLDRVIEQVGLHRVIDLVGLERVIEQVGAERVIAQIGDKELVKRISVERWLANLSPTQRRELKRRLQ